MFTTNLTQEQAQVMELAGVQNWSDMVEWFGGQTVGQIKAEADRCWPHESNNAEFAQRVYDALN